jgi:tripartite-type tricarboxylate transporter receptor subunit TctC
MKRVVALIFLLLPLIALAWPSKDITIVVPYAPGGVNDQLARLIAPDLESILRVPVQIKNMPGAANAVAVNHILNEKNDSHTFLFTMDDLIIGRNYEQFRPVTIIGTVPFMVVGNSKRSVQEFKEQVRTRKLVSIANNGAQGSAAFWLSQLHTTLQINPIPYKGLAPELTDVLAGQVDYGVASVTGWHPHIQAGKLVPIMVSTNRIPLYPNVPGFKELGIVGPSASTWFGVFARQDTDTLAVKKFSDTVRLRVKNNIKVQNLQETGMDIVNLDATASAAFISREITRFTK